MLVPLEYWPIASRISDLVKGTCSMSESLNTHKQAKKYKYTGDSDAITLRGITFEKGKAVAVDCANLQEKLSNLDYFAEVKTRGRKRDKKQD